MSAGFTPGPWVQMSTEASIDDNCGLHGNEAQRMDTWHGIGNPELSDPIVAIAVFHGEHDDPEFDANINLIAAAPDLYEALKALLDDQKSMIPLDLRTKARAAVDRAEGGDQ